MKDIKELNKWLFHAHGKKTNIVKISILPNFIYRFNAISIKIPASHFVDINKMILMFTLRGKSPRIANTKLKEKNKVKGLLLPNFKTHCKATVVKTMWY